MTAPDLFGVLARYYDPLMSHVNYDRWFSTTTTLAGSLDGPVRHLDAACGTGTLIAMLRKTGWNSAGSDISPAMLRVARRKLPGAPLAVADLLAMPFNGSFNLITCLFDSLNFILDETDLARAFRELHGALADGGLLYTDIITERMVLDHFEGQSWEEDNAGFRSHWSSEYDKTQSLAESYVRVNTGSPSVIRERIHDPALVRELLEQAGFQVLAALDADTWKAPRKKTTRIDFVAVKNGTPGIAKRFQQTAKQVRELVYGG